MKMPKTPHVHPGKCIVYYSYLHSKIVLYLVIDREGMQEEVQVQEKFEEFHKGQQQESKKSEQKYKEGQKVERSLCWNL
jgi:hypothetical protein